MIKPNRKTNSQFIQEANQVHNNKYDYSLVVYINNKTNVKILCPQHGEFEQTPFTHLIRKCGCKKCSGKKLTKEIFVSNVNKIHKHKYDYSLVKYVTNKVKVTIICPIHGEFKQTPSNHINYGCIECRKDIRRKTNSQFIQEANEVHGEKYNYSLVEYLNSKKKVKIICPEHGFFEQTPNNHISKKQGCPECKREKIRLTSKGGYSETYFKTFPIKKEVPAKLYLIHGYRETDNYLKIGITINSVEYRYKHKGLRKNDYKILKVMECSLYEAYQQEQQILKEMEKEQYWPNFLPAGKTECFKYNNLNIQKIKLLMDKYLHET